MLIFYFSRTPRLRLPGRRTHSPESGLTGRGTHPQAAGLLRWGKHPQIRSAPSLRLRQDDLQHQEGIRPYEVRTTYIRMHGSSIKGFGVR